MSDPTIIAIEGIVQHLKRHEGVEYVYVSIEGTQTVPHEHGTGILASFGRIVPVGQTWSMRRPHPVFDDKEIVVHATTVSTDTRLIRLAVAIERSHSIGKSIKRMLARGARRLQAVTTQEAAA